MILEIKKEGDPVLRQPTEEVTDFGLEFQRLVSNMIETMRAAGMGLSAPQIGLSKKLFICELPEDNDLNQAGFPLTVVANPEIISTSKQKINMVEGCLSVPGRELLIKRPKKIHIRGSDRYGKKIEIEADGLFARVIEHELDHLNSTLIIDHIQTSRVLFIGSGSLGIKAFERLLSDSQYRICAVVTGAGQGKKRDKAVTQNLIKEIAKRAKIKIIETKNINDEKIVAQIKKLRPSIGVMADFGQIISEAILRIPKFGIINIHPSLLPRQRGASPLQQTILEGDKTGGVTLILTTTKMDTGPIIASSSVELSGAETAPILKEYLADLGATLLLESLPYFLAKALKPIPQNEKAATYTKRFKKEDGYVDAKTPAALVERMIRAFNPWPGVFTRVNDKMIRILAAHFDENGRLIIDRVKPEGKKEMNYTDFLAGYRRELTFD